MVKNSSLAEFSPAQKMALAMLGYYRWLPRTTISTLHCATAVTSSPSLSSPLNIQQPDIYELPPIPPKQEEVSELTTGEKPLLIPLQRGTSINISRNYTLLTAENLPCLFLLPPLWASHAGLHCFATPTERVLWLNAWRAVDINEVATLFHAFFAATIPIQTVPDIPLTKTLEQEGRPIVCVGQLHGENMPDEKGFFYLTHPWFLCQKPRMKKTFWLELLALKEQLF